MRQAGVWGVDLRPPVAIFRGRFDCGRSISSYCRYLNNRNGTTKRDLGRWVKSAGFDPDLLGAESYSAIHFRPQTAILSAMLQPPSSF